MSDSPLADDPVKVLDHTMAAVSNAQSAIAGLLFVVPLESATADAVREMGRLLGAFWQDLYDVQSGMVG